LVNRVSGESGGAAVAVGVGAGVVGVEGAVVLVVVVEVAGRLGAAPVGAEVSWTTGGALVHPATSAPVTRSTTATRGIPIP
jgi:hypothetical protein